MGQLIVNVVRFVAVVGVACIIIGYEHKFVTPTPPPLRWTGANTMSFVNTLRPWQVNAVEHVIASKFKVELVLIKLCLEVNTEFVDACVYYEVNKLFVVVCVYYEFNELFVVACV